MFSSSLSFPQTLLRVSGQALSLELSLVDCYVPNSISQRHFRYTDS